MDVYYAQSSYGNRYAKAAHKYATFRITLIPILRRLEDKLPGIRVVGRDKTTAVVACTDDATLFITAPQEIRRVTDAIRRYEGASGAQLNVRKSKAVAIGSWDTTINVMDIP